MPRTASDRVLALDLDGAEYWPAAALGNLTAIEQAIAGHPVDQPGIRLIGVAGLNGLLEAEGAIGGRVARCLGSAARPVRMILFDKSVAANWTLG